LHFNDHIENITCARCAYLKKAKTSRIYVGISTKIGSPPAQI
jgi:hypothetical protein